MDSRGCKKLKSHEKSKKLFIFLFLITILTLLSISVSAYDSETGNWEMHYWNSQRSSSIPFSDGWAQINDSADIDTTCSIASRTLTAQPLIINHTGDQFFLITGTTFFEIYNDGCALVADLILPSGIVADPVAYAYNGTWQVFAPFGNNTIQAYIFNKTHLNHVHEYGVSNITNSAGICEDISGVPYCFWQNTTNDLVRLTLSTRAVTPFSAMGATVVDTTARAPSIDAWSGTDKVALTGRMNTTHVGVCIWSSTTEALYNSFNSGNCLILDNSDQTTHNFITPPTFLDLEAGSSTPRLVIGRLGILGTAGNRNHLLITTAYSITGAALYTNSDTLHLDATSTNHPTALYNVVQWNNGSGSVHGCSMGQLTYGANQRKNRISCVGVGNKDVVANTMTVCGLAELGGSSGYCQWARGDFHAADTGSEFVADGSYFNLDGTGTFSLYTTNVTYDYFGVGDMGGDVILDFVTSNAANTAVSIKSGVFANDLPYWVDEIPLILNADSLVLCLNDTYTISTITGNNYNDDNSDDVRIVIDAEGDFSYNSTSSYALVQTAQVLSAQVSFNTTGSRVMSVYLQDEHMVGEVATATQKTFPVYVTSDEDACSAAGTGSISSGFATSDAVLGADTPEEEFTTALNNIGLSGVWIMALWIIIMLAITGSMIFKGVTNPYALGMINLFLVVLGWTFGAISTAIIIVISILLAIIGAVAIFTNKAGG